MAFVAFVEFVGPFVCGAGPSGCYSSGRYPCAPTISINRSA